MSKPIDQEREAFAREDRYIVIKLSDLAKIPAKVGIPFSEQLTAIQRRLPKRECLVIESDWPEYQVAWSMIEARMTGKQPAGVAVQEYGSYTTRCGEMVAGIALRQLGAERRWVEIRDLNAHAFHGIGANDMYPPGTELIMPAATPRPVSGEQTADQHNAAYWQEQYALLRKDYQRTLDERAQDVADLVRAAEFARADICSWIDKYPASSHFNANRAIKYLDQALAAHRAKQGEKKPAGPKVNPCAEMEARLERLGIIPPLEPKP